MYRDGRTPVLVLVIRGALVVPGALAMGLPHAARAQQVLVEGGRLGPDEVLTTKTIYAFRNLPDDAIKQTSADGTWVLSNDAIIGAALNSPTIMASQKVELRRALTASADTGETKPAAVKLALTAQRRDQGGFYQNWFSGDAIANGSRNDNPLIAAYDFRQHDNSADLRATQFLAMGEEPKIARYPVGKQGDEFIDTVALSHIVDSGALATPPDKPGSVAPTITPAGLVLDPQFAASVKAIYATIGNVAWNASPAANGAAISAAKRISFSDPQLAATTMSTVGKIEFGKPIAYTIDDKKLVVEPSLLKRFDVYWIDFAFSPSEDVISRSSEMDFSVALADHTSMALQLAPRELDRAAANAPAAEQAQGTGTVMVQNPAGTTTIDRFYNQSIEYHYLRPTIHSIGLQGTTFGWDLADEMLTPSAKRFVAILAVPKHATEVKCTLTVAIRIRQSFWSKIDEAVSDPVPCDIKLPR